MPEPDIALLMVFAAVSLNTNAELLITDPAPNVPVVPPLPTDNVPALIVVVPAYVLFCVKKTVPAPD